MQPPGTTSDRNTCPQSALPRIVLSCALSLILVACGPQTTEAQPRPMVGTNAPMPAPLDIVPSPPLVAAAREQIGVTRYYDPAYVVLDYPGGDVSIDRGVCTDVVVRALRVQGIDLQKTIHQDMRENFRLYPQNWGLSGPDRNIDHRRVPNQMRWFERQGWQRPVTSHAIDYSPGDIVAWRLRGSGLLHVGIVSDRRLGDGTPLVLHNVGRGTQEDDLLFHHDIIGHYRPALP